MAVNKIIAGDEVLIDLTQDTATPADVRTGVTFHNKYGYPSVGTCDLEDIIRTNDPSKTDKGFINKVVSKNNVLLDLTQDTITPYDVKKGKTFHMRNGEIGIGKASALELSHVSFYDGDPWGEYIDWTNNCTFDIYTTDTENGIRSNNIQILPWKFYVLFAIKPDISKRVTGKLSFDYTVSCPNSYPMSLKDYFSFTIIHYRVEGTNQDLFSYGGGLGDIVDRHVDIVRHTGYLSPNYPIFIKLGFSAGHYLQETYEEYLKNNKLNFEIKNIKLDGRLLNLGNYNVTLKKKNSILDYIYGNVISKEEYPYYIFTLNTSGFYKVSGYSAFLYCSKNDSLKLEYHGEKVDNGAFGAGSTYCQYKIQNYDEDKNNHKIFRLNFYPWVTCYQKYPSMSYSTLTTEYIYSQSEIINSNYDIMYQDKVLIPANPIIT